MSDQAYPHRSNGGAVYCHCYPIFVCKPAIAEVEGPENLWWPVCERCQRIAWDAGLRVRKLQTKGDVS